MKIKLKQLEPNPFRDLVRYPIHREKIEMLKASIRTTGFWDNVLVRFAPVKDQDATAPRHTYAETVEARKYQIAYGHHRLEALRELIKEQCIDEDFEVDLPVRHLDDASMLRIMATENAKEYGVSCEVLDETVRSTRDYISRETKTPLREITAVDIAQFLGGGWHEDKVGDSLQRMGLFDRGAMRPEDVAGLSPKAARQVMREVSKVEKGVVREQLEEAQDEDKDLTEDDRKVIRRKANQAAQHVAGRLGEHLRSGGAVAEIKEKSFDAQAELIPEEASEPDRKLSTIDAAARAVHARDFQRKIEMLLKYKAYMSPGAKHELAGTLREVKAWCTKVMEGMDE